MFEYLRYVQATILSRLMLAYKRHPIFVLYFGHLI